MEADDKASDLSRRLLAKNAGDKAKAGAGGALKPKLSPDATRRAAHKHAFSPNFNPQSSDAAAAGGGRLPPLPAGGIIRGRLAPVPVSQLQPTPQLPSQQQLPETPAAPKAQLQPLASAGDGRGDAAPALRGPGAVPEGGKQARLGLRPVSGFPKRGAQTPRVPGLDPEAVQQLQPGYSYLRLIHTLRQYPNSEDFVYLRRQDSMPSEYNPYALEVVPFSAVDHSDFYTLSTRGMTYYKGSTDPEFTTLDHWERQLQLFDALKGFKIFKLYKLWKSLYVWRKCVRGAKISRAKAHLEKMLFTLSPIFQKPLQQFQELTVELSEQRLYRLQPNKVYRLEEFVEEQQQHQEEFKAKLEDYGERLKECVQQACSHNLQKLEERLAEFHTKQEAAVAEEGQAHPPAKSAKEKIQMEKGQEQASQDFAYTIAAARRSEQRRLMNFVRMSDYKICDTLHTVLVESASELLQELEREKIQPRISAQIEELQEAARQLSSPSTSDAEPASPAAAPLPPPAGRPLFEVEVALVNEDQDLILVPSESDYTEGVGSVLDGFMDVLCTLDRLMEQEDLMEPVLGETELEEPTALSELVDGSDNQALVEDVHKSLSGSFGAASSFLRVFHRYRDMVLGNKLLEIAAMGPLYVSKEREPLPEGEELPEGETEMPLLVSLGSFRQLMDTLIGQKESMEALKDQEMVGIILLNCSQLKNSLIPSPTAYLQETHDMLPRIAAQQFQVFIDKVHEATSRLKSKSQQVEDFVNKITFLEELKANEKELDRSCAEIQQLYDLIDEYGIAMPEIERAALQTMLPDFAAMKNAIEEVEGLKDDNISKYNQELEDSFEALQKEVTQVRNDLQQDKILQEDSDRDEVVAFLRDIHEKIGGLQGSRERINKFQKLFKVAESRSDELTDTAEEANLKLDLWVGSQQFDEAVAAWRNTHFEALNLPELEEAAHKYHKMVFKIERGLPPNKVVPQFRGKVDLLRNVLPVVQALSNHALKERHWAKIQTTIGKRLARDESFTLGSILDMDIQVHKEGIQVISTEATQEQALEQLLAKVQQKWAEIEFQIIPYKDSKDTFILGGIEEVTAALEDSMVTMSTILSSRFIGGIRSEVEKVEKQLTTFSDTLDEWLNTQKNWMYLESIFTAPDIQRQLPNEYSAFSVVNKHFIEIMRKTKERPNAMQAGTSPNYQEIFQKSNETLEKIQKELEDYLESKRIQFPRFYFLSNDELLEILAETKNVRAVQPHLQKCFDGISRLQFGDEPKSIDILAIVSGEGENVPMGKNLKARGNVETWLGAVEQNMIQSLRRLAKAGYVSYPKELRSEWVLKQPAQLVLVCSQIHWCLEVERALRDDNSQQCLADFLTVNIKQLNDLTALVRGQLEKLHRKILVALITIDVHARDIIEGLHSQEVSDVMAFDWQMQLRYSWNESSETVIVLQVNASFEYAYEYLGAQSRLVVTPMTDRCYMTLTGALHLKLGGAPAGPAGTGKTETTKDLGKALGVNCVVFNCGDNLDYKFMAKFFAGLAQCGAWACFDEFNRIDIEVLSVVAQQLLTIQNALKANLTKFNFEGRPIKLVPTCGVFITMNPGYAGRTELPDNLKALFRPMAMMIPDYALVAEVMLFSEGFQDSKSLSRKMVKLYKLSSEQLSQQDHYDFGMRALKSVLVMAGSLKRANPDLNEDVVLIRAMRDSNLPKFLADDLELFQNIIADLFPGVEVPDNDYGQLESAVVLALERAGLQRPPGFVNKIIQFFETLNVRFGVMLVGPTTGGKTVVYKALQRAMTYLRQELKHEDERFQTVHTDVLNPKCIKMGELYGQYNALTNEWCDGLGSTLIRTAVADTTVDRKWVMFDGPVDAIWIENMNTVLDDNCTLCLPNGERIKLNPHTMRMLFEVQDLAVASPATVSRCGMVYVDPTELGWLPFVRTWVVQELHEHVPQQFRDYMLSLFESYVQPGIDWVRQNGKEYIPSVDNNLVTTIARMVQSMMLPKKYVNFKKPEEDVKATIDRIFALAFTWGLGGNLSHVVRDEFDGFVRDHLSQLVVFPGGGTVFDYYLDTSGISAELKNWNDVVPSFSYSSSTPYFQMLVPTLDTVLHAWLLEMFLDISHPVLFTGVTGVGKSVIATAALEDLRQRKSLLPHTINFSAQTPAKDLQLLIESKLEKKRKTRFGAPVNKRLVFFVDDVNMPARETYGAQPPVELLRQFLDFKGFYDREKLFWKDIEDTTLCAACAPPGGGRQEVTPRFFRHFAMLCIPPPSDACTKTILSSIFNGFLQDFPSDFKMVSESVVKSSVEAYTRISEELLPTPAKSHYTFNLRDLSKVFQGLLMVTPSTCPDTDTMAKLWIHESMRVFHDRLIDNADKQYFKEMLFELLRKNFSGFSASYEELFTEKIIFFGDFLVMGLDPDERQYQEVQDVEKMIKLLDEYQMEYNMSSSNSLSLVFFMDAVEHIARISRILRQPRGNAMLVGVGGSGKQSLTRFAAHIGGFKCISIELSRGYGINEFREDLKKLYHTAGIEGKPVVFLFTDNQIVTESFLEDINNMLNSGEVPGMLAQDEKDRICNDIREWVEKSGGNPSKEGCYSAFINRVRDNLHIVLAMSPVGEAFRARCRLFPSLINCTTIDWFTEWPEQALLSVSQKFLQPIDLGTDEVKAALAKQCVEIHSSVSHTSDLFWQQLRRKFYTTPKSYLDLIGLYTALLKEKRDEYETARDRLLNGLHKLNQTNAVVDGMKAELAELAPVLEEKSKATAELLVKVQADQEEAEKIKAVVQKEAKEVNEVQQNVQVIADDAKADLQEALPILEEAVKSLDALNKNDITEIKSFAKPPALVQMTMEAVCILKGEKADWDSAKRLLSQNDFMQQLKEFNKEDIADATIKKLKKYIDDPQFLPEVVGKQSQAAKSLCMWVRAMDRFHVINKVVEPKKAKLAEAEQQLADANAKLKEKQDSLQLVVDKVRALEEQLEGAQREQQELKDSAVLTEKRLERAGKLTSALSDEGVRWQQTAEKIKTDIELLVGDVFVCAACIAYYGAFTGPFRDDLVRSWITGCQTAGIPVAESCTLKSVLASPVEVREWSIWGLPMDDVSVDNGILVTRSRRWPLMIDPQGQANTWIKAMEGKAGLRCLKLTDSNFLRTLENSIRIGMPVLFEDVGETLDPALEPVLQKAIFKQGGRTLMRLGDTDIDYDPNFKLYITTKLPNPHYLPEICIKVTIINFTVTEKGLEDQLLGDVVRKERPDLEEQKDKLVVQISNDKKQLQDLEDKILKLLKESEGNILDDEVLINTLNNSKLMSGMIQGRVQEAEVTEKSINEAREHYRPAATRGSILYFVVADLALIGPMYQYSLTYFTKLFNYCIDSSEKAAEVAQRLEILSSFTTSFVYNNVQRGLFEEHKMLFSFLLCTAIRRHESSGPQIPPEEWTFLVRDVTGVAPGGGDGDVPCKPAAEWITPVMWRKAIVAMRTAPELEGLGESMAAATEDWHSWFMLDDPQDHPLPQGWDGKIRPFQKLLIMKIFREDKLQFACQLFVGNEMGKQFTEPPPWRLEDVFPDTTANTPIIFVLSTGADPTNMLQRFADQRGWTPNERLHIISLGQGQGPVAETMIKQMEAIVEELSRAAAGKVHEDFRLWLTSMPSSVFPVAVLQNGIKLTNEPPKGVKANVKRTFNDMTEEAYDTCSKPQAWKKLLFSLSFFHAVIQERRKFGPVGWNIRYEFNQSDLECGQMTIKMFLEEQEQIPWQAMEYVLGQINYGGRVTDDNDRRCLMSILRRYVRPAALDDDYKFTPSGIYHAPPEGPLQDCQDHIAQLPGNEAPEVFGLHSNASIKFELQEMRRMLDSILSIQPRIATAAGGKSPDEVVAEMATSLQEQIPPELTQAEAQSELFQRTPSGHLKSLSVVLRQEMDRFNRLTRAIIASLAELQKAIKGQVVMSGELERMYNNMLDNKVPELWTKVGYPSLKPLSSWFQDYLARIAFMRAWLTKGSVPCFWLPGFFFPQGFLTGVLQQHARKYMLPIDTLNFSFSVTPHTDPDAIDAEPEDGTFISGLWVDGARWDHSNCWLEEAYPSVMFAPLPVVHFVPQQNCEMPPDQYHCPLYKTSVRAGVLSTTGQSTNFVLHVSIPIRPDTNSDFWVLQGVALLCMLDE